MPKWQHSCDHPCTGMGKAGACDALFIDPTTSQPKSGCLEAHLLSVPVLADLCTGALTEKKKYSPSFVNQSWRGEKTKQNPVLQFQHKECNPQNIKQQVGLALCFSFQWLTENRKTQHLLHCALSQYAHHTTKG